MRLRARALRPRASRLPGRAPSISRPAAEVGQSPQVIRHLRIVAVVLAISGCVAETGGPGEVSPEFGTGESKAKGVILHFRDWPPDAAVTEPLLQRLQDAGLELRQEFPRFSAWVFEWDNWKQGRKAENLCLEFLRDDRVSPLLDGCEPDYLLHPG